MRIAGPILLALAIVCPSAADAQDKDDEECTYTVGKYGAAEIAQSCEREIAGMASDVERAAFLFRLGWSMNENDAPLGALAMLERVVKLAPDNATYWQELGFTQGDLGWYAAALASLDRALAIDPEHTHALNERGWVRQKLGDFAGANEDYERYFALEAKAGGQTSGARIAHARNLVWLGLLDEAEADLALLKDEQGLAEDVAEQRELIARIRAYRPTGDEAALCELDETLNDRTRADRIFDACTRAFLDSTDAEKRADFLTVRAVARQAIEDTLGVGYDDLSIAAWIDPQTARRHVNTGFALLQLQHSWAARNDFDKALAMGLPNDQTTAIALAGRAQANFNLDERDAAVADAKRAIELAPNQVATQVLGDIAFADGDKDFARTMWLAAYRLGGRDDDLIANLKSVGVDDPANWRDDDAT